MGNSKSKVVKEKINTFSPDILTLEQVIQKLGDNPDIIYLKSINEYLCYNPDIKDVKILYHEYENIMGNTVRTVKFTHEIVIVDGWDKNAVYYYLDSTRFPNAKLIIMNSHPCEYGTLTRAYNNEWKIIALNNHRWFEEFDNITVVKNPDDQKAIYEAMSKIENVYTTDYDGKLIHTKNNLIECIKKMFT